jgi:hypothetical protein
MKTATLSLVGVTLARVNIQGHKTQYDGTVTLHAKTSGLDFKYVYKFADFDSVPSAIAQAAGLLKRDLEALSAETQNVLRGDQRIPEDDGDTDGPGDD